MKIRVPFDENYVSQIGKAVYLFSYYEWTIIYLVEQLQPGFVKSYSRGKPMTSGDVLKAFKKAIKQAPSDYYGNNTAFWDCFNEFKRLKPKRDALVHAHPITDIDGSQILNYQGEPKKLISDLKWDKGKVCDFIRDVDAAACRAGELFYKLKDGRA